MERRKKSSNRYSELPDDYLKLVREVFTANFDEGLREIGRLKGSSSHFEANGRVYPEEVVLAVTLLHEGQIAATTVYASSDFDPKASSPTVQDVLAACVDAAGSVFGQLLSSKDPEKLKQLAEESLSAFEDIPFEWTQLELERFRIHVKVDKANPRLDRMADDWLSRNDPDLAQLEETERQEAEKLFITGPTGPSKKAGKLH